MRISSPDEMLAADYIKERYRMHNAFEGNCKKCPLNGITHSPEAFCGLFEEQEPEKAVAAVKKWADENPEKPQRNYLEDFFTKLPKAPRGYSDTPIYCRDVIYRGIIPKCTDRNCYDCWREPMREED